MNFSIWIYENQEDKYNLNKIIDKDELDDNI